MHVAAVGRGGPFEADQGGELAGLVVFVGGVRRFDLPGAARRLRPAKNGGCCGVAERLLATTYLRNHARCSSYLGQAAQLDKFRIVVARRAGDLGRVHFADELGVVGDRGEIERLDDLCCWPLIVIASPLAKR